MGGSSVRRDGLRTGWQQCNGTREMRVALSFMILLSLCLTLLYLTLLTAHSTGIDSIIAKLTY